MVSMVIKWHVLEKTHCALGLATAFFYSLVWGRTYRHFYAHPPTLPRIVPGIELQLMTALGFLLRLIFGQDVAVRAVNSLDEADQGFWQLENFLELAREFGSLWLSALGLTTVDDLWKKETSTTDMSWREEGRYTQTEELLNSDDLCAEPYTEWGRQEGSWYP